MRSATMALMLNEAIRLRSMMRRKSSNEWRAPSLFTVRCATPPPAVLTMKCAPPSASIASCSTPSMPSKSITLHGKKRPPSSSATSDPADFSRSSIATCPPAALNRSAVARHMPEAPPTNIPLCPLMSKPTLLNVVVLRLVEGHVAREVFHLFVAHVLGHLLAKLIHRLVWAVLFELVRELARRK